MYACVVIVLVIVTIVCEFFLFISVCQGRWLIIYVFAPADKSRNVCFIDVWSLLICVCKKA